MSISDSVAWLHKQLRLCVADVNEILIHTAGGSAGHMTSGAFKDPLYTKPIRNTPAIQQECVCVQMILHWSKIIFQKKTDKLCKANIVFS